MTAPTYELDDLEQFEGKSVGIPKARIIVSSQNTTSLYLSASFLHLVKDGYKPYIKLSYSKKSNAIALEFTDSTEKSGIFKLSKRENLNNATVALSSFVLNFGLNSQEIKGDYLPIRKEIEPGRFIWVILLNNKWD